MKRDHVLNRALPRALTPLLLTSLAMAGGEGWYADFDEGMAAARAAEKHLFVEFTGSDWCPPCQRLEAEVFSQSAFVEHASKDFVLVKLDFPRSEEVKAKVPDAERNYEVQQQYGITGYPTVLLMNVEGFAYAQLGYMPGGTDAFLPTLDESRSMGMAALAERDDLAKRLGEADVEGKRELLVELQARMEELASQAGGRMAKLYLPLLEDLLAEDADGSRGLREPALVALLEAGAYSERIAALTLEVDPKNEKGLFEKLVVGRIEAAGSLEDVKKIVGMIDQLVAAGEIKDEENARQVYINATFWHAQVLGDTAKAKQFASRAKELLSDDDPEGLRMMIQGVLDS